MHVFITGASGWIGSAVAAELLDSGHTVTGLVRSAASARTLEAQGAAALRGDLDDLESLRTGARHADAVIHLANKHDWGNPDVMNRAERTAVETLGDVLAGSDRPFVVASGVAGVVSHGVATEDDLSPAVGLDSLRGGSENLALSYVQKGVRASVVRFAPSVHGAGDTRGFVAELVRAAHRHGRSLFVEEGANAWAAVHRKDAARLVRLGLEGAVPGSRLHAVAEEAVPTRAIAEAIGDRYGLPVGSIARDQAVDHFGAVGHFWTLDVRADNRRTRDELGWTPSAPTLVEDIATGGYDAA